MTTYLYFDGSCECNGAPEARAAYGWIAKDDAGAILATGSGAVGDDLQQTNNTGEYGGLLAGLAGLAELRARGVDLGPIIVRGDSALVINQARGIWTVGAAHLVPLCDQARDLARAVGVTGWQWVRREENTEADALTRHPGGGPPGGNDAQRATVEI